MPARRSILALLLLSATAPAADHALVPGGAIPDGPAEAITKALDAKGHAIKAGDETIATIWLAKAPPLAASPSLVLGVSYQFTPGQFLGLLHVTGKGEFGDFRDQKIKAGVYTLRYGVQPEDGNHIGTSETADFLLALPVAFDKTPAPLDFAKLAATSAKSVSSSHPAILSMLPPGKAPEKATLSQQGDFEVLVVPLKAKSGEKDVTVALSVVVVGHGDE